MMLSEKVTISGRFLRSVRIDKDFGLAALDGYVFPLSLKELLLGMARQHSELSQGAFTWTGPYGSGKSSLVVALSAILGGSKKERELAAQVVDPDFSGSIWKLLPPCSKGWRILPVVGERAAPHQTIHRELVGAGFASVRKSPSETQVINDLIAAAESKPRSSGGLIVFIDELGKFLENAASSDADVYFFQLLAEAASRSKGRLLVIGILHQAFEEYANQLATDMRREWSKVQGRYSDIPVNITGDEQIELLGRAIATRNVPSIASIVANKTAKLIRRERVGFSDMAAKAFANTWPLHPATATALGAISRRSYGQNQRSIFGFLNSSETHGFQDFLRNTKANAKAYFTPTHLWDYLSFNLASSIAASNDSHHFSAARESMERCQANGGTELEISLLKTIALLELTHRQSGLSASLEALCLCHANHSQRDVKSGLEALAKKSLIIFKSHRGSFSIFEGSDFDIELATEEARREMSSVELSVDSSLASVSTIIAKRHYHETGTLRWCKLKLIPAGHLIQEANAFKGDPGAFGIFIVALPTAGESQKELERLTSETRKLGLDYDLVLGLTEATRSLMSFVADYEALRHIRQNRNELRSDRVARREVEERLEATAGRIEQEFWRVLKTAKWHFEDGSVKAAAWSELNSIVSDLADARFSAAPIIQNELLNRIKPSGSANAALKQLLHAMVQREGQQRLGFDKYPAEWGLFASILEASGLYVLEGDKWSFTAPNKGDPSNLYPLWQATKKFLSENSGRSVQLIEIYEIWRNAPFGVKDGVHAVLAVAFLLSQRSNLAYYREGVFLSTVSDVDVDYLLKAPQQIQIRWMDMTDLSRKLLAELADVAAELSGKPVLELAPIDVARALVAAFDGVAPWVHRTNRLSKNAIQVRSLFKKANDPNKFIFDDIPALYADRADVTTKKGIDFVVSHIKDGLDEILNAYPQMIGRLRDQVLQELQVHNLSPQALEELRDRAANIKGITGDLRIEAFITRLEHFDDSLGAMDSLAGLAVNKPAKDWLDTDLDKASVELIFMAQQFNRFEMVARVKGRKDKRDAMAVIVGIDGRPVPILKEFDVLDSQKKQVKVTADRIEEALRIKSDLPQNVLLAALATVSARVIQSKESPRQDKKEHA